MDFLPPWGWKVMGVLGAIVVLTIIVRNVSLLIAVGWRAWASNLFSVDPQTWWMLGALVVVALMLMVAWVLSLGGLFV